MIGGVALGYNFGTFQPAFVYSALMAVGRDQGRRITAIIGLGCLYIESGRNALVERFLETNCEWLWFMDTDIGLPSDRFGQQVDALGRLLEESRGGVRKIVAAAYWTGGSRDGNYAAWLRADSKDMQPFFSIPKNGTIKLGACGLGCTIVHRKVFEDIAAMDRDHADPWVWFGRDLIDHEFTTGRTGEDVSFCLKARAAGHDVWGVCDLVVDHYKTQVVAEPVPGSAIVGSTQSRPSGLIVPSSK